jgi:hypothetical protein
VPDGRLRTARYSYSREGTVHGVFLNESSKMVPSNGQRCAMTVYHEGYGCVHSAAHYPTEEAMSCCGCQFCEDWH